MFQVIGDSYKSNLTCYRNNEGHQKVIYINKWSLNVSPMEIVYTRMTLS